ncbi:MAG: methyltransferase domain-containing protein, partial [Candidatus Aenigmatarchaeota archaeon]
TIFRLCDFRSKKVLEIGPAEGHFVKEASKFTGDITAVDAVAKLPFADRSFDIVLSRWIIQNMDDIEMAVKEMCRVAKSRVIIVLPSDEGDETGILEIKFPGKSETRKNRVADVKKRVSECGFEVREERRLLNFVFPDLDETVGIFSALSFGNKLSSKETSELRQFLSDRKREDGIHVIQGTSFICGHK